MNLERAILTVMLDLSGRLTTTGAIHSHVGLSSGSQPMLSEVALCLQSLERKGQVTGVTHEDYGHRWVITDAGKVRLSE